MSKDAPPSVSGSAHLRTHRGSLILALGILSFVCCTFFGVVAWIMGNSDLAAMRAGRMDPSGEGLTQAGRICGIVSVCLNLLVIGGYLLAMLLGLIAGGASGSP